MKTYSLALLSAFLCLAFSTAQAVTTWHVEANGLDSSSCGTTTLACRSITYTINRAASGDTILVGPGRYGDLNHDGDLNDPGEEASTQGGVINITKPLRVVSTHGAGATIIDAVIANTTGRAEAVSLSGSGITFGAPDAGFTIVGNLNGPPLRAWIGLSAAAVSGAMRIEGNVVTGMYVGFDLRAGTGSLVVAGNYVSTQWVGYDVGTTELVGKITLTNNVANSTGDPSSIGFEFFTPYENEVIPVQKTAIAATGNVSSGNGVGYSIQIAAPIAFQNNTASGNFGAGVQTRDYSSGGDTRQWLFTMSGLSAIGNLGPGIDIGPRTRVNVTGSNFMGNDIRPNGNCGVHNHAGRNTPSQATNNYWGATTGPGPDKADLAGGVCDMTPSVTTFKPFATKAFVITR